MDTVEKLLNVFYLCLRRARLLYLVTFCWLVTVGGAPARVVPSCDAADGEMRDSGDRAESWLSGV